MIVVLRNHARFLSDALKRARAGDVTYEERGATRSANMPPGYQHDRRIAAVGRGDVAWSRAQDAIRRWCSHDHAGIRITPADAPIEENSTVLASRSLGPVLLVAPCRIVYVTETPTRFGFAYGTLPGHPEQGEEAFHVQRDQRSEVSVEILAFSRPADLATRLAGPLARQIQQAAAKRYIEGISAYVQKSE